MFSQGLFTTIYRKQEPRPGTPNMREITAYQVAAIGITLVLAGIGCVEKPKLADSSYRSGEVIFQDALDGRKRDGWRVAPENFVEHRQYGTVYYKKPSKASTPEPWVGDQTWHNYRVEVEILRAGGEINGEGHVGIDFHVQNDGSSCCNVHFHVSDRDKKYFEVACVSGRSFGWKLWKWSQRQADLPKGCWIKLGLDVGANFVNVYVNDDPTPVGTFYDLPLSSGGIRLFTGHWGGACYFRNLCVTSLSNEQIKPILESPWENCSKLNVIRKWKVTLPQPPEFGRDGIPEEIDSAKIKWLNVETDRRGVLNLTTLFPENNTKNTIFAKTIIKSAEKAVRKCWVTYTDRFTIWCNGVEVFRGPPRGWNDPGRAKYGWCRLISDQFEVELPLEQGKNIILVRSEVTEIWGWGFWMRLDNLTPAK
jgi:hypothetical protein